jgi:hypothetical protein
MFHSARLLSALAVLSGAPALAADADWFASLYTPEGIELRADERVYTLFAVLNAMGYDQAPLARTEPVPEPRFHPVRAALRSKVATAAPEVHKAADAFFDAHPKAIEQYLSYAVQAGYPPFEQGAKARELKELAGLEGLLKTAHAQWGLGEQLGQAEAEYRSALKGYLPQLDAPFTRARKLLKVADKGPAPVVVMNLLEADGKVRGAMGEGEVVLAVGTSEKADVEPLLREYARVLLEPVVAKKARGWGGGNALLREAQSMGATESTATDYATALFTRALALKAMEAPDAAYEAAARQGYFGLKDIARAFEDGRSVDAWALEALARAETRRPAKK